MDDYHLLFPRSIEVYTVLFRFCDVNNLDEEMEKKQKR